MASLTHTFYESAPWITASSSGESGTVSAGTALTLTPEVLAMQLSAGPITLEGHSRVAVQVSSAFGTPMASQPVVFSGQGLSFASSRGVTDVIGQFVTTLTPSVGANTTTEVVAAVGSDSALVARVPLKVADMWLSISLSPASVSPGEETEVTVTLADGAGNRLQDHAVFVHAGPGISSFQSTGGVTDSSGRFVTKAVAGKAFQSVAITASSAMGDISVYNSATLDIANDYTNVSDYIAVTVSPPEWTAGGAVSASQSVIIKARAVVGGAPFANQIIKMITGGPQMRWSPQFGSRGIVTTTTDENGVAWFSDTVTTDFSGKYADLSVGTVTYEVGVKKPSDNKWVTSNASMLIRKD